MPGPHEERRDKGPQINGIHIDIPLTGPDISEEKKRIDAFLRSVLGSAATGWELVSTLVKTKEGASDGARVLGAVIRTKSGEAVSFDEVKPALAQFRREFPSAPIKMTGPVSPAVLGAAGLPPPPLLGASGADSSDDSELGPVWKKGQVRVQIIWARTPLYLTSTGEPTLSFFADSEKLETVLMSHFADYVKGGRLVPSDKAIPGAPFLDPDPTNYPHTVYIYEPDLSVPESERRFPPTTESLHKLHDLAPKWHELPQLITDLERNQGLRRYRPPTPKDPKETELEQELFRLRLDLDVRRERDTSGGMDEKTFNATATKLRGLLDELLAGSLEVKEVKGVGKHELNERRAKRKELFYALEASKDDVRMLREVGLGDRVKDELLIHFHEEFWVPRTQDRMLSVGVARLGSLGLAVTGAVLGKLAFGGVVALGSMAAAPLGVALGCALVWGALRFGREWREEAYKRKYLGMALEAGQGNNYHMTLAAIRRLSRMLQEENLVWYGRAPVLPGNPATIVNEAKAKTDAVDKQLQQNRRDLAKLDRDLKAGRISETAAKAQRARLTDAARSLSDSRKSIDAQKVDALREARQTVRLLGRGRGGKLARDIKYQEPNGQTPPSIRSSMEIILDKSFKPGKGELTKVVTGVPEYRAKLEQILDLREDISELNKDLQYQQRRRAAGKASDADVTAAQVAIDRAEHSLAKAQREREIVRARCLARLSDENLNTWGAKSDAIFRMWKYRAGQSLEGRVADFRDRFGLQGKNPQNSLALRLENLHRIEREFLYQLPDYLKMKRAEREAAGTKLATMLLKEGLQGDIDDVLAKLKDRYWLIGENIAACGTAIGAVAQLGIIWGISPAKLIQGAWSGVQGVLTKLPFIS